MLKFTYLVNFGMAGALLAPAVTQELSTVGSLERSLKETERAIAKLESIRSELDAGDYRAVSRVLSATETPFGSERERQTLIDRLRVELGELGQQVEHVDIAPSLPHLDQDPTASLSAEEVAAVPGAVGTTGLSDENRSDLGQIWPPISTGGAGATRTEDDRYAFEDAGFSVDAVRQGQAYYRAARYKEALRLFQTRAGEPEADYWCGRAFERLGHTREALASYVAVVSNDGAEPALKDRATKDREFLQWLVDFDRKVKDLRSADGGQQ